MVTAEGGQAHLQQTIHRPEGCKPQRTVTKAEAETGNTSGGKATREEDAGGRGGAEKAADAFGERIRDGQQA